MASTRSRKSKSKALVVMASKGGIARREALSSEERSSIAKRAAEERWAVVRGLPKETHAGILKLGDGLPCSVLDNKMRVFSVNGLLRAFDSGSKGRATLDESDVKVPALLRAANLRPYISDELMNLFANPVSYRSMGGGMTALGYEANIIRRICDTLLDARAAGVLRQLQLPIALAAEKLVRAFADVGIIALIDEATGYQADRAGDELRRLVEAYVVEDMRPWARLFPDTFFRQVYRIHGWQYKPGVTQGPRYVGKFINKYVYSRLPKPVLDRLRELSPVINKRRKHHLHRFLTEEIGEPTVDRHIASVTTLMSVASEKTHFDSMFRVAFPQMGDQAEIAESEAAPALSAREEDSAQTVLPLGSGTGSAGWVDVDLAQASVRERILGALRGGNTIGSGDLAMIVYGDRREGTLNKLRKNMSRFKAEGVVESPSKGIWKMSPGSRA